MPYMGITAPFYKEIMSISFERSMLIVATNMTGALECFLPNYLIKTDVSKKS